MLYIRTTVDSPVKTGVHERTYRLRAIVVKKVASYPSGGTVPMKKRRNSHRGLGTKKEFKPKPKAQLSPGAWLEQQKYKAVDNLCVKLYQSQAQNSFETLADFCKEYADLVIDKRFVKNPSRRAEFVEVLLEVAEDAGRVDVFSEGRRIFEVQLSESEEAAQYRRAEERAAQAQQKWRARLLTKGPRAA